VSDKTSSLLAGQGNATDKGPWYEGTAGERIAVRLSSTDTNGAYAIVESVTAPGCSPPMHLHRNEEEHFVVLAGTYRILIEDKVFDAPVGTSITCPSPKLHPHGIEPACNIVTSSSHFGRDGDVAVWQITDSEGASRAWSFDEGQGFDADGSTEHLLGIGFHGREFDALVPAVQPEREDKSGNHSTHRP